MKKDSAWRKEFIDKRKTKAKVSLSTFSSASEKQKFLMGEIRKLSENETRTGHIDRFVYAMYALLIHDESGGLTEREVKQLGTLASATLRLQGIRPRLSRLAYLHRDLHLVLSKIYRRQGDAWPAAWEQQFSAHLCRTSKTDGTEQLSKALRALRLGFGAVALNGLKQAIEVGLIPKNMIRAKISQIQILRLAGNYSEAFALIEEVRALKLDTDERKELEWESLCCKASESGNIDELVLAVRKNKQHHSASYIADAFLWSRATQDRKFISRFPRAKTLARNPLIKLRKLGMYYKCIETIERCYDFEFPFTVRLQQAAHLVSDNRKVLTLEKELLLWLALARWLVRSNHHDLAVVALSEYQGLSLRINPKGSGDALGLAGDLFSAEWFQKEQKLSLHEPVVLKVAS